MKQLTCILLLFSASSAYAQVKAVPAGVRQADQTESQTDKNIPPPITQRVRFDMARLRQDADELARIAQTIPPDVSSIQKGLLPKDMSEKLKQIEKLSKQIRKQLSP